MKTFIRFFLTGLFIMLFPTLAFSQGRLIDVSTRVMILTGDNPAIVGFVIPPGHDQNLLVRAVSPSLKVFYGIGSTSNYVKLLLYRQGQFITSADSWYNPTDSVGTAKIMTDTLLSGAFQLDPQSKDAVIDSVFTPGAYTAVMGLDGVGLIEVYKVFPQGNSSVPFVNISTLANTHTSLINGAFITGFVVIDGPLTVLIRAVGPSLKTFGLTGVLNKPQINLNGVLLVGWNNDQNVVAVENTVGAFPLVKDSLDTARVLTLQPGAYTAIITGADGKDGLVLGEVYAAPTQSSAPNTMSPN